MVWYTYPVTSRRHTLHDEFRDMFFRTLTWGEQTTIGDPVNDNNP